MILLAFGGQLKKPPTIDDRAQAAVDSEWRTAREIFAIVDQGAFVSTVASALLTPARSNDVMILPTTRRSCAIDRNWTLTEAALLLDYAALLTHKRLISIDLAGKSRLAVGQIFQNLGFILIRRQFHQPMASAA
jgi:hypothetical protein